MRKNTYLTRSEPCMASMIFEVFKNEFSKISNTLCILITLLFMTENNKPVGKFEPNQY